MTREELREHCKRQVEGCEMWAKSKGEEPSGKVYEEHKLILELLEQENILNKIRAEIERKANSGQWSEAVVYGMKKSIVIIDKYRESEE